RNFKWTYWGSRTSDGCQSAFALMANREPAFYKVALQNTLLFQKCTHNHLLYGGPHYVNHGILPCVHHTLGHSKALATLLVKADSIPDNILGHNLVLPREQEYGVKTFDDIQTWLIARKDWRATITGFDQEYTMKGGHATGGAMTMLWHPKTGPVIVASMNNYQLVESSNMQRDKDPFSMSLTPRFEIEVNKNRYSNSNDLKAIIDYQKNDNELRFQTHSQLVDENQNPVPGMPVSCEINYAFTDDAVVISAAYRSAKQMDGLKYILPIVSSNEEKVKVISRYQLEIEKPNGIITIQSKTPLNIRESVNGRIFNFVPGMEALPLELSGNQIEIRIGVRPLS
ncbi:MAG: hypothetical protein Q8908_09485, partial [Bacteroidota bacterium]|nr:hypothetical protein [Bacteroidota bacterium]